MTPEQIQIAWLTIGAAFVGGLLSGLVTQLTMFVMQNRKESRMQRQLAVRKLAKSELKMQGERIKAGDDIDITKAHRLLNDNINLWVSEIEKASDMQLSVYLGMGDLFEEETSNHSFRKP